MVLTLSLLCVILVIVAVRGYAIEERTMWKLVAVAGGIAVGIQAWQGLGVLAEPWRIEAWHLSWPAVFGSILICGRGLLWKNWI